MQARPLACRMLRSLAAVVTGTRHRPEACWLAHIPVEWAAGKTIRGVVVENTVSVWHGQG